MSEFFPVLSEVKDLRAVRAGVEIEVRFNGAAYCTGRIEQMDADLGVVWVRDKFNEPKLFNASDFTFWRYVL
jgi:hypothetical protein